MPQTTSPAATARSYDTACASWDGCHLRIDSGPVARCWRLVDGGLCTEALETGPVAWVRREVDGQAASDWRLPGFGQPVLRCRELTMAEDDDQGFTARHLAVTALFVGEGLRLRLRVRAYPGVGLWVGYELEVDGTGDGITSGVLEDLSLATPVERVLLAGYHNDTQNRNRPDTPLLREEWLTTGSPHQAAWASIAALCQGGQALIAVKESHLCVNQPGIDGGTFALASDRFTVDGWGLPPGEVGVMSRQRSWATWWTAASDDPAAIAAACRAFARTRFPCDPDRDIYTIANTWGSGRWGDPQPGAPGRPERRCAWQGPVLEEIESCGDLGIDVLQIDDGWQTANHEHWGPGDNGWHPHPEPWPEGWVPAREAAGRSGVCLGLWAPAEAISAAELLTNWRAGGFCQYKLDFACFERHQALATVMERCRSFILETGSSVRVNWDVTENQPRFGYFFGRELGAIFLANRKPDIPASTIYEPWLTLRDAWQLARYAPLKQFQISIQNPAHTHHSTTASKHGIAYCLAIGLAGIPLFFHRTSLYAQEQRREVRRWLAAYRHHREALHAADCQPVGEKPCNATWTGFRYACEEDVGYLLIYRELHDERPDHGIRVPALAGQRLVLTDCLEGTEHAVTVGDDGLVPWSLSEPASAALLRYRCGRELS